MSQTAILSEPSAEARRRAFRDLLGRYATGVVVIAASTPEGPQGMAANSFTSVSLDPPLIAFCPMRSSSSWAAIRPVGGFAVSILGAGHEDVARRFTQKGVDRFGAHDWRRSPGGHPILAEALGWLDATAESTTIAGDHEVVLARVDRWSEPGEGGALVFHGGRYHALG